MKLSVHMVQVRISMVTEIPLKVSTSTVPDSRAYTGGQTLGMSTKANFLMACHTGRANSDTQMGSGMLERLPPGRVLEMVLCLTPTVLCAKLT